MNKSITIEKSKLLLVEGKDELRNLSCLLKNLGINDIQILDICGKTNFDQYLKLLMLQPNFSEVTSMGIIRDADADYNTTFQSIEATLKKYNLRIGINGNGLPEVKVFLLSDDGKVGCFEELFLNSIKNDPILNCVNNYVECVQKIRNASYTKTKLAKAKMSTFLASNISDPDKRFAESIEAGIWDLNDQTFNGIKNFLRSI